MLVEISHEPFHDPFVVRLLNTSQWRPSCRQIAGQDRYETYYYRYRAQEEPVMRRPLEHKVASRTRSR
jgi:hypothetical protein